MRLKDVRLEGRDVDIVCVLPDGYKFVIGALYTYHGSPRAKLNRRQLRILVNKMCNAFNAEQTYAPLEKQKKF